MSDLRFWMNINEFSILTTYYIQSTIIDLQAQDKNQSTHSTDEKTEKSKI